MKAALPSVLLAAVALGAGVASAQAPAALDLGAPAGAERTAHRHRDFDTYALPTGVYGYRTVTTEPVSGDIKWQAFRLADPTASTDAIMENYRERLAELGFEPVFACRNETCGGFDFRFHVTILPAPHMLMDVQDFAQHSAWRREPEAYASVLVSRVQETVYVQTVAIEPAEAPEIVTLAPPVEVYTQVLTLPVDERALLAKLNEDGHVAVEGLAFQQGGAELSPESDEALALLARLLTRDADLAVVIVGHSDNEGGLEVNLTLSEQRASAVKDALIDLGVPEGQLEARGVAFLAPLTSNATEDGRARNRRVELVLRSTD
ncbi:MAG: OmpA family protein [Pseudomonadota bacterium]